jgi:hydrogenase 3 maturation protease
VAEETRQLVVLGVGNRLRGDDAIGCILCDEIKGTDKSRIASHQLPVSPDVFVLDCGNTPENYIQPVADRHPTRILVVDCCDYGAKPGEIRLFTLPDIEQLSYGLLSTHTLPLTLTIEMLSLQTQATIELLGIQPEQIEFGEDLSEPVRRALPALVEFIRDWAQQPQPV